MKDTLLRPTSTVSQPGSVISEGEIRRRGRMKILVFEKENIEYEFSDYPIVIDGISWSTSMVYRTTSSGLGFLSHSRKIRTSK